MNNILSLINATGWDWRLAGTNTIAERQGECLEQLARTATEQRQSIELLAQAVQFLVETRG